MGTHKKIGKGIKEKLGSYTDTPDDDLWSRIEGDLDKKKRPVPFWIYTIGLVGFILAIIVLGGQFIDIENNNASNNIIVNSPTDTLSDDNEKTDRSQSELGLDNENSSLSNNDNQISYQDSINNQTSISYQSKGHPNQQSLNTQQEKSQIAVNRTSASNRHPNMSHSNMSTYSESERPLTTSESYSVYNSEQNKTSFYNNNHDNSINSNHTNDSIAETNNFNDRESLNELNGSYSSSDDANKQTVNDSIPDAEFKKNKEKDALVASDSLNQNPAEKDKKEEQLPWSVTVMGMRSYYINLNDKSAISDFYDGNEVYKNGNYSYGLSLNYNATDDIQIRIGVSKINLNQTTRDIPYHTLFNIASDNYNFGDYIGQTINNQGVFAEESEIEIRQELEYIEIPIQVRLRILSLLSDKVDLSLNTGISYLFLTDDRITLEDNQFGNFYIGDSSQINKNIFSLNAGLGVRTQVSNKFYLNADAMFNYQNRPYEDNELKRAVINLGLGIEYKF